MSASFTMPLTVSINAKLLELDLFRKVKESNGLINFKKLVRNVHIAEFGIGQLLWQQGTVNNNFMLIAKGRIALHNKQMQKQFLFTSSDNQEQMGQGQYFWQSLLQSKSICKVEAIQKTTIYQISNTVFYLCFKGIFEFPEVAENIAILNKIGLFNDLDSYSIYKMACHCERLIIKIGTHLISKGSIPDCIYILVEGELQISRPLEQDWLNNQGQIHFKTVLPIQVLCLQQLRGRSQLNYSIHCLSNSSTLLRISAVYAKQLIDKKIRIFNRFATQVPISRTVDSVRCNSPQKIAVKKLPIQYQSYKNDYWDSGMTKGEQICLGRNVRSVTQQNNYVESKVQKNNKKSVKILQQKSQGSMLLMNYLVKKKYKQQKFMIDYMRSKPPELVLNPSQQFSLVKPLHVRQSSAILNRKKVLSKLQKRTQITRRDQSARI